MNKVVEYIGPDANGLFQIILNNPPVNALSSELIKELSNILSVARANDNIKLVMIIGNGKHFSAGADLKERSAMSENDTLEFLTNINRCFDIIENLQVPTICLINGATLGGGAELALCCDIVATVASSKALSHIDKYHYNKDHKIGFPEVGLGIIPGAGGTYRIFKRMSQGVAKHWILSGRKFSLEEAFSNGFVDFNFQNSEDFNSFIDSFLSNPRLSLVAAKTSMNKSYLELDRKKQRLIELEEYKKTLDSPYRKEALRKYKGK